MSLQAGDTAHDITGAVACDTALGVIDFGRHMCPGGARGGAESARRSLAKSFA
jgi:hypothetical protein